MRCLLSTEGGLSLPWRELLIHLVTVFLRMLVQNNRMYIQTHPDTHTYPYPTHTPNTHLFFVLIIAKSKHIYTPLGQGGWTQLLEYLCPPKFIC